MSDNAITDDVNVTELPQAQANKDDLVEEKKIAKFSKSAEFKRIKKYFEERITFYQKFQPDGRELGSSQPTAEDWRVANAIIKEFNLLLDTYGEITKVVETAIKDE